MIRNEGAGLRRVILVPPVSEYTDLADLTAHNFSQKPDKERAIEQHVRLHKLLESLNVDVITVGELRGDPNSVFVRDVAVITPAGAVRMRMGLASRENEEKWIEQELLHLKIPIFERVTDPASAEGGDIILAGNVAFVGKSTRTNDAGVDQITRLLLQLGFSVRVAEVPDPYLHIGGAMSVIAPDRVLCTDSVFPVSFFEGFETITVPRSDFSSGNVITVRPNEVIADTDNRQTIQILQEHHVTVHAIDLSEFIAGTGGPSCLILPVERD